MKWPRSGLSVLCFNLLQRIFNCIHENHAQWRFIVCWTSDVVKMAHNFTVALRYDDSTMSFECKQR